MTTTRDRRAGAAGELSDAISRTLEGSGGPQAHGGGIFGVDDPETVLEPSEPIQQGRTWKIWFAARPGPNRKRTKTIGSRTVAFRSRRPELPPSMNTPRGNHYGHAAWVKVWRQAGRDAAVAHRMPYLERVRIAAVVYRRNLGNADEDNDRSRLKPILDGIRDAGVIKNDTRQFVEYGSCTEERAGDAGPGILLLIEEITPATSGEQE